MDVSILQTCAATSPNSLEIYFRTGWWYLQTGSGLLSGQKIKKKSKMAVLGLSGHLLSRYIVHLGLKNTPGLIFEVPGPQNPVKKLILKVFPDWFRTNFRTGCWTSLVSRSRDLNLRIETPAETRFGETVKLEN